jgi:hypothetical protein
MKKTIGVVVFLLSTVVLMSSCKKDVKYLPGTWKVISATINNDSEDDVRDVWTFNDSGDCVIDCDLDEYFDNIPNDNMVTFGGSYSTSGNDKLTITGEKFNVFGGYSDQVVYELDIETLTKKLMIVSGTIKYYHYMENVTETQTSSISLSLSKK